MIVITAPTSMIGRQVVENLLASEAAPRVVARDPDRLPADVRDRCEVVAGSHGDATVMQRAFDGADAVFWLAPPNVTAPSLDAVYSEFARPACEALPGTSVSRVVGVSALGRGFDEPAGHVTASLAMDDMLAATGVAYRALTMPSFMDNVLRQAASIASDGVFIATVAPDRALPTCATRDIAAVASRLLLDDSWTGVEEVPVLGPEDLSHDEMAQIMSDVLGRPVRYQQVPLEGLRGSMLERGASEAIAQGMVEMMGAKDNGLDNMVARTPANSTPTSFRQWCEEVLAPAVAA